MATRKRQPRTSAVYVPSAQVERAARRVVAGSGSAAELRASVMRLERPLLRALTEQHATFGETPIKAILRSAASTAVAAVQGLDNPKQAARRVANVVHESVQAALQRAYLGAGIETYVWVTQRDARVRPIHARLHGTTHRWDTPPVVDESGARAHPGEYWGCRCYAAAPLKQIRALDD